MLLAALSGTALVLMTGYGLWRGSEDAQQRALWTAQREARDAARGLRAALQSRNVLDHAPAEQRFVVRAGTVVVDPDVGWLTPQDEPPHPLLKEQLRLARVAEFVDNDADAAAKRYDDVLADAMPEGDEAKAVDPWLLLPMLQAAWQAHRAGDSKRRDQLRAVVDRLLPPTTQDELRRTKLAEALASATLLAATVQDEVTDRRLELLSHAGEDVAAPLFARLRELPSMAQRPTLVRAASANRRIADRRALLARANAFVRDDAFRGAPQVLRDGQSSQVALWFSTSPGSNLDGEGALVDVPWLATLRGHDDPDLPPVPAHGELVFGDPRSREDATPRDAEPVLDGTAWLLPSPPPPLPWFSRASTLFATAALLLLLFSASAWATLRGLSRANQAMRARTEFLTGVTHELKTPIASMRLIADVLHDDRPDLSEAQQQRYLAMLTGEAARLTTLIDNVLDLGQIERGERAYDLQPDCAADAVRETVHGYEALAQHHGMALELREGPAKAAAVIDRGAIAQALRNLLENARKYAGAGSSVEVTTSQRGGTFVVRVQDSGPGIPAAERDRVFERFVRGSRHTDGSVPGVGLGLFLSREIARRHGGELRCVEPEDAAGAAFELTIPCTLSKNGA